MSTEPTRKLRIEYIKSNFFRIVHADGVFGGISPRLELFITFFSERFPIPKVLVYETSESGPIGQEISAERETKEGIIREVEVGIKLDLPTAKALALWLNDKIAELENAQKQIVNKETEEITG